MGRELSRRKSCRLIGRVVLVRAVSRATLSSRLCVYPWLLYKVRLPEDVVARADDPGDNTIADFSTRQHSARPRYTPRAFCTIPVRMFAAATVAISC
jgi:hypothetical protein